MLTVAGTSPIEIGVRPGSELSFHASAQGKVLLAFAPRPMQQRVLGRSLQAFTARTIVDVDRVKEELTQTFKRGYAAAPEEGMLGINAVAAPVFDGSNSCVAAIAIVGSIEFLPEQPNVTTFEALAASGREISRKLSGHSRGINFSTPELRLPQRKVSSGGARKPQPERHFEL